MAGRAFTIKELFAGKGAVKGVAERTLVTIPAPFPFKVGDTVFKVSSETAFTMSENACVRRLEGIKPEKVACSLTVTLVGETMRVAAQVKGIELVRDFPLGSLEAARTADMEGVLRAQFTRTGDTPFELASFSAPGFPPLLIPSARLKEIRRECYAELSGKLAGMVRTATAGAKQRALASLVAQALLPGTNGEN